MHVKASDILVIGSGIFGATAALELHHRGFSVSVIDEGTVPHPLAASTDISKVVRMEYGADEQYMAMVEASIEGFHEWNERFGDTLYHETGVTMFTRNAMASGGFEYESYQMLLRRGHAPERLNAREIAARFPAWKEGAYVDGFFHAVGGYAESGRTVSALRSHAISKGIRFIDGRVARFLTAGGAVTGVMTMRGEKIGSDHIVVAAGAWTQVLVPALSHSMKATGHPVFHLKVTDPELFSPPHFGTFTADVARTGWYGFPVHPKEGVIKIANHGVGQTVDPDRDERRVSSVDESRLRDFLSWTFPALVNAPIVYTRLCLYCDTKDEHLWIDHHPALAGLTIAAGGSGHGFKFAPVLGPLIADAVENKTNPWLEKFRWRDFEDTVSGEEAARCHG